MIDLEVVFFPCACGHERIDHVIRGTESDGTVSSFLGNCHHDRAFFKGMCLCPSYKQMTKLEYLEYKSEKV